MATHVVLGGLLLATSFSAPGPADNSYSVLDLGSVQATAINDHGRLAGYYGTASGASHAFLTGDNGAGMIDLGASGIESHAFGINARGQVVGYYRTTSGQYRAFVTGANGVGMTDLGTLGGPRSHALAISARGDVVGYSSDSSTGSRLSSQAPREAGWSAFAPRPAPTAMPRP